MWDQENKVLEFDNTRTVSYTHLTVLWNGPVGVFEFPNFRKGTEIISHAIANSDAFSIAGGGDTLAAIDLFGIADKISYIDVYKRQTTRNMNNKT